MINFSIFNFRFIYKAWIIVLFCSSQNNWIFFECGLHISWQKSGQSDSFSSLLIWFFGFRQFKSVYSSVKNKNLTMFGWVEINTIKNFSFFTQASILWAITPHPEQNLVFLIFKKIYVIFLSHCFLKIQITYFFYKNFIVIVIFSYFIDVFSQ